jgi:hypothetical protein
MSKVKVVEIDHKVIKAKIVEIGPEMKTDNGFEYRVFRVQEMLDGAPQDLIFKEYGKRNGHAVGGEYTGTLKIKAWKDDLQMVCFTDKK